MHRHHARLHPMEQLIGGGGVAVFVPSQFKADAERGFIELAGRVFDLDIFKDCQPAFGWNGEIYSCKIIIKSLEKQRKI